MANPANKLRPVDLFEFGKLLPPNVVYCPKTDRMRDLKGKFIKFKISPFDWELRKKFKAQLAYIRHRS